MCSESTVHDASATVVAVSIAARMVGILGMGISVVLVVLSAVGLLVPG